MTATADKARYFLEQSVPELKEYERKKIFNSDEITSIAKKRSDFEHKINARGSTPSDYARYAEFEINVDALRRKRVKRMGVKSVAHNGQRRIYFVFDRGTRKFPGDVGLWMQSIEYAKRQRAHKKLMQMFTTVLRLHPTKSELWIYVAQFAIDEHGDMTEARSYMQRGLRFCKNNRSVWLEYARLELAYMIKILARRQILGIGSKEESQSGGQELEEESDILRLPKITAGDITPDLEGAYDIDLDTLQRLDNTPVMSGAIPRAIFESAMSHFQDDAALARTFFDLFASFSQHPASPSLMDHVLDKLQAASARQWQIQVCYISRPLIGVSHDQPEYPSALKEVISRARSALTISNDKSQLLGCYGDWLRLQIEENMDPVLQQVILAHLNTLKDGKQ